jgi:hypothetical protein
MSVVELKPKTRHSVGDAICGNCRHEWVATAPAGTTQLECPEYATHRGAFKHPFGPCEGDESFKCNCGSFDFYISRKPGHASGAVYCRGCGNEATGWFE